MAKLSVTYRYQASRRAYRLIQRKECRVYYIAYENTVQAAVIALIALKQAATSAIQGKFSTEGIAAMAEGVDEKVQLAAAMSNQDFKSGNAMQDMFDVLSSVSDEKADIEKETRMKTLAELLGPELTEKLERKFKPSVEDILDDLFDDLFDEFNGAIEPPSKESAEKAKTGDQDDLSTVPVPISDKRQEKEPQSAYEQSVGFDLFSLFKIG